VTGGKPPFEIPQMRFVNAALAVAQNTKHDTYMLEEVIDEATDGGFVKYIGNGSAKPYRQSNNDLARRGQFLAFAQHVQYLKTKHLAFVGDFQGGLRASISADTNLIIPYVPGGKYLLTDPQIITAACVQNSYCSFHLSLTLLLQRNRS
jgi:hypothetical protein